MAVSDPRAELEAGLSRRLGRTVRIVRFRRRSLTQRSSHPISRLEVRLDSGEELRIIFKRPRRGPKLYGNEREVLIYTRLLDTQDDRSAGGRFGAPALYHAVYAENEDRFWLFLEDIGDQSLKGATVSAWEAVVQWMARLHAAYLGRDAELRTLACLSEHDALYWDRVRRQARRNLARASTQAAVSRFDHLMERYDRVIAHLTAPPRALVHGDIFAQNLMVQDGCGIRPIDWESAAIGLPAWDLAQILYGWNEEWRGRMIDLYVAELRSALGSTERRAEAETEPPHGIPELTSADLHRSVLYCDVAMPVWYLRGSLALCRDMHGVEGLLSRIEQAWGRLEAARG